MEHLQMHNYIDDDVDGGHDPSLNLQWNSYTTRNMDAFCATA